MSDTAPAVRELAERLIMQNPISSSRFAEVIQEAIAPLLERADDAAQDLPQSFKWDARNKLLAELTRWEPTK